MTIIPKRDKEHPALAIGLESIVNGKEYLTIDYDVPVPHAIARTIVLHQKFPFLHSAFVFGTQNGASVRFYFDFMPREKILKILEVSECDPNYLKMVREHGCSYRTAGKWSHNDLYFIGEIPNKNAKPLAKKWQQIGESLIKLANILRVDFPKQYLLGVTK